MRQTEGCVDSLVRRIEEINGAVEALGNLNEMLAMPKEFHEIVKGNRRPIQEH